MDDFSVLKKLAQDANEQFPALEDQWSMVCTPTVGLELLAEIDRLRTAEGDAMTYKAGMENVAQQRDQLKTELEKVKADRKACWEEFKVQGRQLDQLKQEHRLLTEYNEFLASSDSRLAPELRAVKDALGLDFTASVSGEVVPLIERLRKLPTCWTEVLEQSEANDQLLDQVLELSKYADRWKWLEGSADSATWEQIGYQEHMNRHLHVDAAMAKGK
jgi:flagellar biosynthesis regulator FlaF